MRRTGSTVTCLALAGLCLAGPRMHVGTKLTWRDASASSILYNDDSVPIVRVSYGEEFAGPTVEAVYGPFWGLSCRLDVAQYCFYMSGSSFRLFPMPGLDLMFEPPTDWRVKPYAWAGASLTSSHNVVNDGWTLLYDSDVRHRAGVGAKFRLTRAVELFCESQFFSYDQWWEELFPLGPSVHLGDKAEPAAVGLRSVEFGARFALGK